MNTFLAKYAVGMGLARVGVGATISTVSADLSTAEQALMNDLNSSGCKQAVDPTVTAFQQAYNASGGSPALVVDGLYGANTQAALQATLNTDPNLPAGAYQAPAGCVAAASGGGGNNPSPSPSPTPAPPSSSNVNWGEYALIGAALVGAGTIGYVSWKRHNKGKRKGR